MVGNIDVEFSLHHVWLIKLINYPRVFFGFGVFIPICCISVDVGNSEFTGP